MKIAAIQTSLHWEDRDANLAMLSQKISSAKEANLIVLPEMFATGFSMNTAIAEDAHDGPSVLWMKRQAQEKNAAVCGSLMVKDGNDFYNRMYFVTPEQTFTYDKRHLFSLANEQDFYRQGGSQLVVEYSGWKIAPLVCYDLRFPVWSRRSETFDYDALVYVANWPERRSLAWRSLLVARAIENQAYVVGMNRVGRDGNDVIHSGDSAVVDPMGRYIAQARPFGEEIIVTELSKELLESTRKELPFYNDRDGFEIRM